MPVAYPPTLNPATYTNDSAMRNSHPNLHNQLIDAVASIITIMGQAPAGTYATVQEWLETLKADDHDAPGVRAMTQAQIDAIATADKTLGRVVWNTTLGLHQAWNGTSWTTIPVAAGAGGIVGTASLPYAGGLVNSSNETLLGSITFAGQVGRQYSVYASAVFATFGGANIANLIVRDGATLVQAGNAASIANNAYATVPVMNVVKTGAAARAITLNFYMASSLPTAGARIDCARGFAMVADDGWDGQVATPTGISGPDVWNTGWGVVGRIENSNSTSGITTTTSADLFGSLNVPVIAGRKYIITVEWAQLASTVAGDNAAVGCYVNGVLLGVTTPVTVPLFPAYSPDQLGFSYNPATSGTIAVNARIARQSGTGSLTFQSRSLTVTDVGPQVTAAPPDWPPKGGAAYAPVWSHVYHINEMIPSGSSHDWAIGASVVSPVDGWIEVDGTMWLGYGGQAMAVYFGYFSNAYGSPIGGGFGTQMAPFAIAAGQWVQAPTTTLVVPITKGTQLSTFARGGWSNGGNCYFEGFVSVKIFANQPGAS